MRSLAASPLTSVHLSVSSSHEPLSALPEDFFQISHTALPPPQSRHYLWSGKFLHSNPFPPIHFLLTEDKACSTSPSLLYISLSPPENPALSWLQAQSIVYFSLHTWTLKKRKKEGKEFRTFVYRYRAIYYTVYKTAKAPCRRVNDNCEN